MLTQAQPGSLLAKTISERPEMLDIVETPYMVASWTARERIGNFVEHIAGAERLGILGNFSVFDSIDLLGLEEIDSSLHIVLDKPQWFRREGTLVLNLFRGNTRLYSLPFSVVFKTECSIVIGGIQGRNLPHILDTYRDITKSAFGMRPRDLLLEVLRLFAQNIGARRILAVSDEARHHRANYFSGKSVDSINYNSVWLDRGGWREGQAFYELPTGMQNRDESTIPVRKRSLYRKRYDLLRLLDTKLTQAMKHPHARQRPEAD